MKLLVGDIVRENASGRRFRVESDLATGYVLKSVEPVSGKYHELVMLREKDLPNWTFAVMDVGAV